MSLKLSRIALVLLAIILVVSVFALQGCSSGDTADKPTDEPAQTTQDAAEPPVSPKEEPLHTATYKPSGTEIAVIKTAKGTIKFKFYSKDAPNHVAAFIELANAGFYDGTKFHRVDPNFVIQGGDPLSKTDDPMVGTGGPGYRLAAEFNSRQHLEGTVAMARSQDPDSGGSQFYVCLAPQPSLDGQYTVFGQVTDGMDVVKKIAIGDVMESVTIENASK
ncbi:MAG: peptidylprolyl isomerase [Coriobacteriia bacterium]|nr:peptidylprolyl isomerase [Coriobacteriia bacterium]